MGLCLSKRDVLINGQKPQLSLREQMLSSDLQFRARHFIPDSPSMASMISGDSSSVAEKHLLKNSSIGSSCPTLLRSSISNAAECGSRSSFGEWRFNNKLSGAAAPSDDDDIDDLSSTCPRTSGFSYISSPMVEGIESYGLENISRSYQRAKERFEMEGFTSFNPRLLEIDEEHEDLDDSDDETSATMTRKKTTQPKSLHVFGEGFSSRAPAVPSMKSSARSELGVFGASQDHHHFAASAPVRSVTRPEPPKVSIFKQPQFDSDFSCTGSEIESEHVHPNGRSARWGFVVDSLGSDEMEGDDTTDASRVSTSSTNFESLCRPSLPGNFKPTAFMAVPRKSFESWQQHQQQPNFSHMNPKTAVTSTKTEDLKNAGDSAGFLRGFGAPASLFRPMSFEFVAGSSSDSSSSSERLASDSSKPKVVKQVHLNSSSTVQAKKFSDDDDDGNDSDSSNDLFEIENLGAALGSLSSYSSNDVNKEFIYPAMNNSFLKDPDISYSTTTVTKVVPGPGKSFPFQNNKGSSGGKILGPTLRANVLQSSVKQHHKPEPQRKNFTRPLKKKSALENNTLLFYGR